MAFPLCLFILDQLTATILFAFLASLCLQIGLALSMFVCVATELKELPIVRECEKLHDSFINSLSMFEKAICNG